MKNKAIMIILAVFLFMGAAAATGALISADLGSAVVMSDGMYAQTLPIDFGDLYLSPGEVFMTEGTGSISHNLDNAYARIILTGDTSFASEITGAFYYMDSNGVYQYLTGDMLDDGILVENLPDNADYRLGLSITNGYNTGPDIISFFEVEIFFYPAIEN